MSENVVEIEGLSRQFGKLSIGIAVLLRAAPVVAMAPMAWCFGIACLLLPLATKACAPLALAAHRHIK